MKCVLSALLVVPLTLIAATAPPASKTTPAPAAGQAATNAPSFKEMMKADCFTNSAGMVMVKVGQDFWASKYLVTQQDYAKVVGNNPSRFTGDRNPVDSVSWNDALSFCARLTELDKRLEDFPANYAYTLPTQAQWEQLIGGATLAQAITSEDTLRSGTAPVGTLGANSLGLYDIRGNVWHWCLDPQDKPFRVLRGGAWNSTVDVNLRPEFRWYSNGPDEKKDTFGFRCVLQAAR